MSQSCHDLDIQSLQQFSELVRESEESFDVRNTDGINSSSLVKESIVSRSPQAILQPKRPKTSRAGNPLAKKQGSQK